MQHEKVEVGKVRWSLKAGNDHLHFTACTAGRKKIDPKSPPHLWSYFHFETKKQVNVHSFPVLDK